LSPGNKLVLNSPLELFVLDAHEPSTAPRRPHRFPRSPGFLDVFLHAFAFFDFFWVCPGPFQLGLTPCPQTGSFTPLSPLVFRCLPSDLFCLCSMKYSPSTLLGESLFRPSRLYSRFALFFFSSRPGDRSQIFRPPLCASTRALSD